MKVHTVYAHPNPKSFCRAILQQFTKWLEEAGHTCEVIDLYAIKLGIFAQTHESDYSSNSTSVAEAR